MKEKNKSIYGAGVKNIISLFISQGIVLLVGLVISFVLPKTLGIQEFGYWQVYLLYVTYVMFFGFGFTDGVYLIYGGYYYSELPFQKLRSTIMIYTITAIIFTILAFIIALLENNSNKRFALMAASFNIFLLLISNVAITILQCTNRIKEYSFLVTFGKISMLVLVLGFIILGYRSFEVFVCVDLVVKIFILLICVYLVRDVFIGNNSNLIDASKDWYNTINSGIKIMLSVFASTFVLNISRILLERFEDIKTYSNYSFAITICSFFLVIMNAASLSFYPMLMQIDKNKLPNIYNSVNKFLFFVSFVSLGIYYFLYIIIQNWYQDYAFIIQYLGFFLVITLVQSKEQLLHIVYFKVFRLETKLLMYNILFSILALISVIPVYFYTKSVYLVAIVTCVLITLKSYTFEVYLRRIKLGLNTKNIWIELLLVFFFLITIVFDDILIGSLIFILVCFLFFLLIRKFLINFVKQLYREYYNK